MNKFCGNEELLAAYIDRMLPDDQRILYEKHLSECSRCLSDLILSRTASDEILGEGASLPASEEPAGLRRVDRGRGVRRHILRSIAASPRLSGALIVAAASLIIVWLSAVMLLPSRNPALRIARQEISAALNDYWTGEVRLSCEGGIPGEKNRRIRGAGYEGRILEYNEKALRETLARDPGSVEARRLLGHIFMIRNHPAMARIYYGQILDLDPRDAAALNDLAVAHYRGGDLEKALGLLDSAIAAGTFIPETYYNLAVMLIESGNPGKAEKTIKKYLSIDSSSVWSQRLRELAGARPGE